ncbi:MAG: DnaA regulatory inactivator Hda [Gammaproteobacteria bacterium]|nr:DnaA regulatory inactivator Hda [Gammaproteobacteria bacterium]
MVDEQIPLPIGLSDRLTFSNYIAGNNQHVLNNLIQYINEGKSGFLYLWGKTGTGKSHLLHASCVEAAQINKKPVYLPLSEFREMQSDIFLSMENQDLVCIDDINSIENNIAWEKSFFNLYNQLQEKQKLLIVTATTSPSGSAFELADIKSRLASGIIYHLVDLDDKQRLIVVKERARQRGFELSTEVLDYLGSRVARDLNSLLSWLDRLDEASLVTKRKITVPLIRKLLNN